MARTSRDLEILVGESRGGTTGMMGECVEISISVPDPTRRGRNMKSRVGYIAFVRRGKLLEIIGGEIEAPRYQPSKKGSRARKNGEGNEPEENEPESEDAAAKGRAEVQAKREAALVAIVGDDTEVKFLPSGAVQVSTGAGPFTRGSSWEEAFRAAAYKTGLWQSALATLASGERAETIVPVELLTAEGVAMLTSTPSLQREQLALQSPEDDEPRVVDAFVASP